MTPQIHYNNTIEGLTKTHTHTMNELLTLTVLVTTIDAQWERMGDVRSARYEPALLPPCPSFKLQ